MGAAIPPGLSRPGGPAGARPQTGTARRDEPWPRRTSASRRDRSTRSMRKGPGMRPVVLQMGVALDGFVHGAKGYEDWGLPPEEDEVVAWKAASLRLDLI